MSTKCRNWTETQRKIRLACLVIYNSQRMENNKINSQTGLSEEIYDSEPQSNYCPSVSDDQSTTKRVRWTPEENIRYAQFLKNNMEAFQTPELRKKNMVFSKLSKFMFKRTTSQAKSHHQKMILRHKQVDKIIQYIDNRFVKKLKKEPKKRNGSRVVEQINQQTVNVVQNKEGLNVEVVSIIDNYIQQGLHRMQQLQFGESHQWFDDL